MWWDWGSWWWMVLMMLSMVVFWGGIIALAVWLIVRLTRRDSSGLERRTPVDIAQDRYARGEITREQYEQIKKDLLG